MKPQKMSGSHLMVGLPPLFCCYERQPSGSSGPEAQGVAGPVPQNREHLMSVPCPHCHRPAETNHKKLLQISELQKKQILQRSCATLECVSLLGTSVVMTGCLNQPATCARNFMT
jgi:hypothetical protein